MSDNFQEINRSEQDEIISHVHRNFDSLYDRLHIFERLKSEFQLDFNCQVRILGEQLSAFNKFKTRYQEDTNSANMLRLLDSLEIDVNSNAYTDDRFLASLKSENGHFVQSPFYDAFMERYSPNAEYPGIDPEKIKCLRSINSKIIKQFHILQRYGIWFNFISFKIYLIQEDILAYHDYVVSTYGDFFQVNYV